jgi:hypothetical protein
MILDVYDDSGSPVRLDSARVWNSSIALRRSASPTCSLLRMSGTSNRPLAVMALYAMRSVCRAYSQKLPVMSSRLPVPNRKRHLRSRLVSPSRRLKAR